MKKLLITLAILLAIILAIPFIGNKVIESILDDRIEVLESYGLKVKDLRIDSSYLTTKKHYIFIVKDSKKFISYLNLFYTKQIPVYVDALIDGSEVGLDVEYSNIILDDEISIDIYPNKLSLETAKNIKAEDSKFYAYINKLFQTKTILYHISFDLLNDDFNAYIKDMDESYKLEDGTQLILKLKGISFKGKGLIMAPDSLLSTIKELSISIKTSRESMSIELIDFTNTAVFESKTTYATTGRFKSLKSSMKNKKKADVELGLVNLAFDISSNTQSAKADFYSKLSFDFMDIKTLSTQINITKFNYDLAIRGVSKDKYEQFVELLNKEDAQNIKDATYALLSSGLVIDIADLSLKELSTAKTKNLGGMSIKSKIIFKQDNDFKNKINKNKMLLMELIDMDLLFKMSKEMYAKLALASPILSMVQGMSKEDKNLVIFDIKLKDSKISVNGREIQ